MGLISKIRNFFAGKPAPVVSAKGGGDYDQANVYNAGFGAFGLAGGFGRQRDRQWLLEYEQNCHLMSPFQRVAEDASLIPWKLYRKQRNGKRKQVLDHPVLDLLKRPDPAILGILWRQTIMLHYDLVGEFFLWVEFQFDAERGHDIPKALHIIPPHWVIRTPVRGFPKFQVTIPGAPTMDLEPGEMIWVKRPRPLNPYVRGSGIAPSLDDEVSQLDWMNKFNDQFFRGGAHLGTVLGVEGLKDFDAFAKKWEEKHGGIQNAFKTAVLNAKVTAHQLSAAHKELDFNDGVKLKRDTVRQTIGTPPEIHGQLDNSNKATAQVADHIHQSYQLLPRCSVMDAALNEYLLPLYGDEDLEIESENPVKETRDQILEKADRGVARGTLTIGQWKQMQGLDADSDDDVYLLPVNTLPVRKGQLGAAADIAQNAQKMGLQPPRPGKDPENKPEDDQNGAKNAENEPENNPDQAKNPPDKAKKRAQMMPGRSLDALIEELQGE